MLSGGAATLLSLAILGALAVTAIVVGFIVTGALGQDWSIRTAVVDAVIASAGAIGGVFLFDALRRAENVVPLGALGVGLCCVVLRHVAGRVFGRAGRAPAA